MQVCYLFVAYSLFQHGNMFSRIQKSIPLTHVCLAKSHRRGRKTTIWKNKSLVSTFNPSRDLCYKIIKTISAHRRNLTCFQELFAHFLEKFGKDQSYILRKKEKNPSHRKSWFGTCFANSIGMAKIPFSRVYKFLKNPDTIIYQISLHFSDVKSSFQNFFLLFYFHAQNITLTSLNKCNTPTVLSVVQIVSITTYTELKLGSKSCKKEYHKKHYETVILVNKSCFKEQHLTQLSASSVWLCLYEERRKAAQEMFLFFNSLSLEKSKTTYFHWQTHWQLSPASPLFCNLYLLENC